eukprot:PhM_4_TR14266/c0_g1_i5/m.59660
MVRCKGDPSNEADVHRLKVACLKAFIEPREPTAIMPGLGGVVSFGAAPLPAVKLLVARWSTSVVVDKALKDEYVSDVYEHYEQYGYSESRERQTPADPKGWDEVDEMWQSKRPVEAPQLSATTTTRRSTRRDSGMCAQLGLTDGLTIPWSGCTWSYVRSFWISPRRTSSRYKYRARSPDLAPLPCARQFLAYLKTRLGPTYTTYSIRRTIFEISRRSRR